MAWVFYDVITNDPDRIVRIGQDGKNPVDFYVIEVLIRDGHEFRWEQTILPVAEFQRLNR